MTSILFWEFHNYVLSVQATDYKMREMQNYLTVVDQLVTTAFNPALCMIIKNVNGVFICSLDTFVETRIIPGYRK